MTYRQGTRHNLPSLQVLQVTTYQTTILHDQEITKWRYALCQKETGKLFVYTGVQQSFREGDLVNLRGTVKTEADKYGYVRLARIRKYDPQPELDL